MPGPRKTKTVKPIYQKKETKGDVDLKIIRKEDSDKAKEIMDKVDRSDYKPVEVKYVKPCPLSKADKETILAKMVQGSSLTSALRFASISKMTYYRWVENGQYPPGHDQHDPKKWDPEAYEFLQMIALADDNFEDGIITKMLKMADAKNIWQIYAWFLERRYPEKYGRKMPMPVDKVNEGNGPVSVVFQDAEVEDDQGDEDDEKDEENEQQGEGTDGSDKPGSRDWSAGFDLDDG